MSSLGCVIGVLIARTHDHLPLCSYADENYKNANTVRQQQQKILERMVTPASGPSGNGCHYQSFDLREYVYFALQDAATDLTIVAAFNKLLIRSSTLKETNSIACSLLDSVFCEFIQQVTPEDIAAPSVKPFQFIRFESSLQKCVARLQEEKPVAPTDDGGVVRRGNSQYSQLRSEIAGVHDVIRKNYVDLMERGETLEVMDGYSSQLRHDSNQYYKATVRMNRMRLWKMYGPPAIVALIFLLCMVYYFW